MPKFTIVVERVGGNENREIKLEASSSQEAKKKAIQYTENNYNGEWEIVEVRANATAHASAKAKLNSLTIAEMDDLQKRVKAKKNASPWTVGETVKVATSKRREDLGRKGKVTKIEAGNGDLTIAFPDGSTLKLGENDVTRTNAGETWKAGDKVQVEGSGPVGVIEYVTANKTCWVKIGGERHEYTFTEITKAK